MGRRLPRALWGWLQGLTKPRHRTAAVKTVRASTTTSVLVVCHGNLCRSPYAEARLRHMLGATGPTVRSGGYSVPDRAPPISAITAARARGLDVSAHRSRTIDRSAIEAADLVVVMEPAQAKAIAARARTLVRRIVVLGDFDPVRGTPRAIGDPMGRPDAVFAACFDRIDRCLTELVAEMRLASE